MSEVVGSALAGLVFVTKDVTMSVRLSDEDDAIGREVAAEDMADDGTTLELTVGRAVAALELARRVEDEEGDADEDEDLLLVVVVSSSSSSPTPGIWIRGTRVVKVEVKVVSGSVTTVVVTLRICLFSRALLWNCWCPLRCCIFILDSFLV